MEKEPPERYDVSSSSRWVRVQGLCLFQFRDGSPRLSQVRDEDRLDRRKVVFSSCRIAMGYRELSTYHGPLPSILHTY
eukprot:scaffold1263_cov170-Ochromonas_danica.AAC.11